jgi:hypothetical protein
VIKKTIAVRGQKIEIEIPASYELVQDGNKVELVKRDKHSLKWGEKDSELKGYSEMPDACNNEDKMTVFKFTMNTPLTTIFFPIRLPSLINISKLLWKTLKSF